MVWNHSCLQWKVTFSALLRFDRSVQCKEKKMEFRFFFHLKCIALSMCLRLCVCVCVRRRGGDQWWETEIEEGRFCTGAWKAGYYNNEDGCVYHELCIPFQSFPPHPPPSAPFTLTHLGRSVCVLNLVEWDLILTPQPWCYSSSLGEGVFVSPFFISATRNHPSAFVAKARFRNSAVMGCGE